MKDAQRLATDRPVLKRLRIQRFRGINDFAWNPGRGLNVLLGGGDVGKTTVLDAVALLLSPSASANLTEADFYRRETERGKFSAAGMLEAERHFRRVNGCAHVHSLCAALRRHDAKLDGHRSPDGAVAVA